MKSSIPHPSNYIAAAGVPKTVQATPSRFAPSRIPAGYNRIVRLIGEIRQKLAETFGFGEHLDEQGRTQMQYDVSGGMQEREFGTLGVDLDEIAALHERTERYTISG